jgi:hypothetical protein
MVRCVRAALAAALLAAACGGGGGGKSDDAGAVDHRDGGVIDAAPVPPDAAPPVHWPLSLGVVAGAGHVEGDGMSMDLQIGDFVDQNKMTGGGFTLESATIVKGAP